MGLIDQFRALDPAVQLLIAIGIVIAIPIVLLVAVAILVVIASVLGTFVLGLGEGVESTPQASFDIREHAEGARITHEGGDAIDARNLYVEVDGERRPWTAYGSDSTVRAGDSITVGAGSGQTVRVVYDDGENRAVFGQSTIGE